jgi:hypothetical protein
MADYTRPEIPPEPQLPYRLWFGGLEHHATALGYVCMTYANLEANINHLIQDLLQCSQEARRAIVDAAGATIRNRCQLVLKLARIHAPSDQWFEDLTDLLKRVEGDLAEDRNRLVHDRWLPGPVVKQINAKIYIRTPQAGKPKSLTPQEQPDRPLEFVWDLVRRIQEVDVFLTHLAMGFSQWKQTAQLPEFPEIPPDVRTRRDRAK